MRFCMITTFYPPYSFGGDGVFVQQLANELADRGHDVHVVFCKDAYNALRMGPACGQAHLDHAGITLHALKSSSGFFSPLATYLTGRPLLKSSYIKKILQTNFDVIHYHNISLIGGPKILHYGSAVKVYTLHEYWLICPTHSLFKYNRDLCTDRRCLLCTLVHHRPPQFWRYSTMIKEAVKHVDLFIAPSQIVKKKHVEMGLDIPITELPPFISQRNWQMHSKEGTTAKVPYFLFVGRLEKIKGLHTVIPVFRRYAKAQLWIAGVGEYERVLRRIARDVSNIRFLGYQSSDQLRLLYRDAIAVIVPSLWYEVFGLVILEAFSQATPVIVTNRGAMPSIVKQSGGGFVFDTSAELIVAMDRLVDSPELRNELGRRAYAALHKNWHADHHIERYLQMVAKAMATRRLPRQSRSVLEPSIQERQFAHDP
jgi:glycosyltransferase involved in cell wall biosynthesis